MSFITVNEQYERWLRAECNVDESALKKKHERMKESAFMFLRATFFRWATQIESIGFDLKEAPTVLSVGDSHVENFGTWRDGEGRWVWGVNDFDDAAIIPYPSDLIRLATSASLSLGAALERHHITAILDGYRRGLKEPRPTFLDQQEHWMRPIVACSDHALTKFWDEISRLKPRTPPDKVKKILEDALPKGHKAAKFAKQTKGGGSLGRRRYTAVAEWQNGKVVREIKALVPSGWNWARSGKHSKIRFEELAKGRYRAFDPFLNVRDRWIVRRSAADSRKIEINEDLEPQLLSLAFGAMGFDVAAVHAADRRSRRIPDHLDALTDGWLFDAAATAVATVTKDYEEWRGR